MLQLDFTKDNIKRAVEILMAQKEEWSEGYANFLNAFYTDDTLTVESSGSTGKVKKLKFSKLQYIASAEKSIQYFDFKHGQRAFSALPFNTVGGQLMLIRALLAKMKITMAKPSLNAYALNTAVVDFAPMVYSQLKYLVDNTPIKIELYSKVLLGGGPVPNSFKEECQKYPNQFFASYGMTETLSHVALKNLSNGEKNYTLLQGNSASTNKDGCIELNCDYLPKKLTTTDIGIVNGNKLKILGRKDFVIISSGKKINPETIEIQLNKFVNQDFIVAPYPNSDFGNVLALLSESPLNKTEQKAIKDYNNSVKSHLKIREFVISQIYKTEQKILRQKTLDAMKTN